MGIVKEFKEFALRGNVVDMAVGIIIGAAFGKIVSSLVGDVLMPPIGKLLGDVNFADKFICLGGGSYPSLAAAKAAGATVIAYGAFISAVIDFVIVAVCVFLIVKAMNTLKRRLEHAPATAPTTKECPYCLSVIPIRAMRCAHCTSDLNPRNVQRND
jgi:large conductance mechanosensitive channel